MKRQVELLIRALFDTPTVSGIVAAIIESQVGRSELEMLSDYEADAAFNNSGERGYCRGGLKPAPTIHAMDRLKSVPP